MLAAAEVAPPLGVEAGGAPGHGGTTSTFNQVTSWQVGAHGSTSPEGRHPVQIMTFSSCAMMCSLSKVVTGWAGEAPICLLLSDNPFLCACFPQVHFSTKKCPGSMRCIFEGFRCLIADRDGCLRRCMTCRWTRRCARRPAGRAS